MHFRAILLLVTGTLLWASCETFFPERMLRGQWQALVVLEEGDTLPVDPSEIRLSFDEAGHYTYHSTLNYREAGYYHLKGDLLYTRDTTHADTTLERIVRVPILTEDSLVLDMRTPDQKARVIRFRKISPSPQH